MKLLTFLETLEPRIAPAALGATLHGMNSVTYTEADGDDVTVKFSKKIFNADNAETLNDVFSKDDTTGGLFLDLTQLLDTSVSNGTDITFTVKKLTTGDGKVDVHELDADGALGKVKVPGNLGSLYILNHVDNSAIVLKSLTVDSMVNAEDSLSDIRGNVGTITIAGNISHAIVNIGDTIPDARVDSFTVGGDWTASTLAVGLSRAHGYGDTDGLFGTTDDRPVGGLSSIGTLTIGGHIMAGSDGTNYGIEAGSLGKVTINQVDRSAEFNTLAAYTPLALTGVTDTAGGGVFAVRVLAPNALVNHTLTSANTVSYHEADGDLVTVKFSKAIFSGDNKDDFENVFTFDSDTGIIQYIDLSGLTNPDAADGVGMTFTVKQVGSGDGVAGDVQDISSDLTLGAIKGIGNLDSINIGNDNNEYAPALKSLSVRSMVWDHLGNFESIIAGNVGTVTVMGDFSDIRFAIAGSVETFSVTGDIVGGDNESTGFGVGSAKTITVGNIIGSDQDNSAQIYVDENVGTLTVGNITGGMGQYSGGILINGTVTTAKVGTVTGGEGDYSGFFGAKNAGSLTTGDISGHSGSYSGVVGVNDTVKTAKVGAIQGGSGEGSGAFGGSKVGSVTAASIATGGGANAGGIFVDADDAETAITITGDLNGFGADHALITSSGNIKALTIGGDTASGSFVAKNFGDIKISGDMSAAESGTGFFANTIKSFSGVNVAGAADSQINFQVFGDTGDGYTKSGVTLGSFTVTSLAYSLINVGFLVDNAKVTSVTVNGDWVASALDVGVVDGVDTLPYTSDDLIRGTSHVGSLTIKGDITGTTTDGDNFGIRASVFDKITFGKTKIDAVATYVASTPTVLSNNGTVGHGAVYIERGLSPAAS